MQKITKLTALLLAVMLLLSFFACAPVRNPDPQQPDSGITDPDANQPDPPPKPVSIRITAAGDNLLHDPISKLALQPDGTYDYSYIYQHVKKAFQGSDIAYINEEVMLCDVVANYPRFSAMSSVADALRDVGFNVINLATNHSLDRGVSGLETCLKNVHARDFDAILGAFRTEEESKQQIII